MVATVTEELAGTQSASTAVTFDLGEGETKAFAAFGLTSDDKPIVPEIEDDDASTYQRFSYCNSEGQRISPEMRAGSVFVRLNGPIKGRWNKPLTSASVQIVSYT